MTKLKKILLILAIFLVVVLAVPAFLFFKFRPYTTSFLNPQEGKVNVLVMGKGGKGHEAPDLTDTMILASVNNGKISIVSLPRDIWVPEIRAKLNSAYYWGKEKNEGFSLADNAVSEITGENIDYNLVIDFSSFKDIVDSMGGVEVDVQNSFIDEKYPIAGKEDDDCDGDKTYKCRYETVEFTRGRTVMDGETALKFVRSRYSDSDEGTDIAREKRQQQVINAIKDKVLSPEVYTKPKRIKALFETVASSTETDIPNEIMGSLARKIYDSRNSVKSSTIPEEMLLNPPTSKKYDSLYVFIPKAGDWSEVQKWVSEFIR